MLAKWKWLLITWLAAGLALGYAIVEGSIHVAASRRVAPDPALAATLGADFREVQIYAADGARLRGWLIHPSKPNGDAAIALHGLGDTRKGIAARGRMLAEAGYTVLMPDSRAHGISEGDRVTFGILEKDDLRRWSDWLLREEHPRQMFGLGASLGAAILLQSLENDTRLRAAVAECPFADFRDAAYDRTAELFLLNGRLARVLLLPAIEPGLVYGRWRYGLDFHDVRPLQAVAHTKVPVLLIHGDQDTKLPAYNSVALHAANPGGSILWIVPGAGHATIAKVVGDEYRRRVLAFFQR